MGAVSRFVSTADVHEGAQPERVSVSVLFRLSSTMGNRSCCWTIVAGTPASHGRR